MRYFWTFFWTFLLVQMLSYVITSMHGAEYHFETGAIMGVIVTIFIFVLGAVLPNEPSGHEAH